MNRREFNALLKNISPRGYIEVKLIAELSHDERSKMVYYIVRNRGPVIKDLIPPHFDMTWLGSCGYLYETKGALYTFVHTSEHKIK